MQPIRNTSATAALYFIFLASISYLCLDVPRHATIELMLTYAVAFLAYFWISSGPATFKLTLGIGLLIRLILLFTLPILSDDFHRFIWDGTLVQHNIDPYLHLPVQAVNLGIEGIDATHLSHLSL